MLCLAFITCLVDSFKDEKKLFEYNNQTNVNIQLNQIEAVFTGVFNTDHSFITNIMEENNTKIIMLVDQGLKRKCSIIGGVMFTLSVGDKGSFIYYLLTHPTLKLSFFTSTIE